MNNVLSAGTFEKEKKMLMFIAGVLIFSLIVPVLSLFVSKQDNQDAGKVATSVLLVAWGAMILGLLLAKVQNY